MSKIKISIKGKNPTSILRNIIDKEINIYKIIENNNEIQIIIEEKDYQEIKKIKTSYKIKIIDYYGISKIREYIKKYKLFILTIILGILINIFLSNIIFNIEVIHPNTNLRKVIEKDLNTYGIKKYHFAISNKKKELIKEKILEKEKERVEWLEIERFGTKYQIKLEERKKNKEDEDCLPRNIVSKKDAVIIDISSSSGEIKVKENDYVEKNQVLISGFIYNKDKIVNKRCAKGEVYGETWYKVTVNIPKYYEKIKKGKNISRNIKIIIGKKELFFRNNNKNSLIKEYNIIGSKIIPLNIKIEKRRNTIKERKMYTYKEIDNKALSIVEKNIKKKLKEKEIILDKKVLKKREKDSKIIVEVFLKIKEEISKYQDISEINIEELNKETE